MLGQFRLTGSVHQTVKDGIDVNLEQDIIAVPGWSAKLVANYPHDAAIPDGTGITYIDDRTITVLPSGEITEDGVTPGISLTAHDPDLFDTPLQWTVKPGWVLLANKRRFKPRSWTFNAPDVDEEVSIGELTPVASEGMTSVARGPKGDGIDDIQLDGEELVSYVQGEEVGRVDVSSLIFSGLSVDGTPVTVYDIQTDSVTPGSIGAYTIAETDDAIAAVLWAPIIRDSNGNEVLVTSAIASAINQIKVFNAAAGGRPRIAADGDESSVGLEIGSKGTSQVRLVDGTGAIGFMTRPVSSSVNYPYAQPATTGGRAVVGAGGSDTNVDLDLVTQGTSVVRANGLAVATRTGTETLTSKTLTSPKITSGNAPATATSTGTVGQIEWANGFIYVCVATNTWQRAALSTW